MSELTFRQWVSTKSALRKTGTTIAIEQIWNALIAGKTPPAQAARLLDELIFELWERS